MHLEIDQALAVEGIAVGFHRALKESGALERFGDLITLLEGLHVLKEGLLTADQACGLLQLSRRTFDRKVAEGWLRKEEGLGYSEPRFWLRDILEKLDGKHLRAVTDPAGQGTEGLRLVDLAGVSAVEGRGAPKRRARKAA